ncbi:hypothetical protein QUA27_16500 [Microcoleus sp. Pol14C6]|uniref:uracil-DNA glycosylase family protein n=1 Tax=unclassified Microcoleus TaxID=2642155 RepID=UPI002FD56A91
MTTLLNEIAHCPHVNFCIQNPSVEHPCREIVFSQSSSTVNEYQVPEPWSGRIEQAPVLFLSSNPSISSVEDYPRWSWSDDAIDDFFNNRFGGGRRLWILEGRKSLQKDGTYSGSVTFWSAVRQRAIELFQRNDTPGSDYAITEIVHCKSVSEIGVQEAQKHCVENYLKKVLEMAAARVVVVLGKRAKEAMQDEFNIPKDVSLFGPIAIGDREKLITFLPHPSAFGIKKFANCLKSEELESLRAFLL